MKKKTIVIKFHKEREKWFCQFDYSAFNYEWAEGRTMAEALENLIQVLRDFYQELEENKCGKHLRRVKRNLREFLGEKLESVILETPDGTTPILSTNHEKENKN